MAAQLAVAKGTTTFFLTGLAELPFAVDVDVEELERNLGGRMTRTSPLGFNDGVPPVLQIVWRNLPRIRTLIARKSRQVRN